MMPNFAVIFDMDGVLVDNNPYHRQAWHVFTKEHGFSLTDDELKRHVYGKINSEIIYYLFGKEVSPKEIKKYSLQKEKIYHELYGQHIEPVPGLIPFLDLLQSNHISRAIATSSPPINVTFTLDGIGAKKYFDVIVDDTQVTKGKPDPEIYLTTAKALDVLPADCIVFEDSLSGVESARRAGMRVIGLTTTHTASELADADLIIENFCAITIDTLQEF